METHKNMIVDKVFSHTASGDSRRVTHKSDEFVRVIDLRISDQRPLDDGDVIVEIRRVGARKEVADVTDTVGT